MLRWTPTVNVSLHALGRRFERARGRDRSHAALWRDIVPLADASGDAGERVDAGEGFWLGEPIEAVGEGGRTPRIRSVRTWLNSG